MNFNFHLMIQTKMNHNQHNEVGNYQMNILSKNKLKKYNHNKLLNNFPIMKTYYNKI